MAADFFMPRAAANRTLDPGANTEASCVGSTSMGAVLYRIHGILPSTRGGVPRFPAVSWGDDLLPPAGLPPRQTFFASGRPVPFHCPMSTSLNQRGACWVCSARHNKESESLHPPHRSSSVPTSSPPVPRERDPPRAECEFGPAARSSFPHDRGDPSLQQSRCAA